jgi:hypothetical protein
MDTGNENDPAMSKRTDKTYQSIYGATKPITGSAFIAELIIKKQADRSNIKLPDRFWANPEYETWTGKWLHQKRQAEALFKTGISIEAVLRSLAHKLAKPYLSLTNTALQAIILEEERKIKVEKAQITPTIEISSTLSKPTRLPSHSKIDKLR